MSNIGEEISRKCAGLPLAANFLGGLMRLKSKESDWLAIRDDDIFNTPENPNRIILILKLSYDNLPSHLKKCFSYCCLFPKDWVFHKETLVQLWMAEGFIHPPKGGNRNPIESIGNDYFLSLLSCSFFQDVERDRDLGDIKTFKMHDLVHDLASSVVGIHEAATLKTSEIKNVVSQVRRLRLIMEGIPQKELEVFKTIAKLRTIISQAEGFSYPSTQSNKRLRVIHRLAAGVPRSLKTTISSSLKFKHMRYLDLSHSNLEDVHAESIHQLYNLQTLNLHLSLNVQNLLQEGISSLINLRHLDLSWSDATLLPNSITRLTNLQTLNISFLYNFSIVIPLDIGSLKNLSSLDISETGISELPDSICLLSNLTKFNFKTCVMLEALPHNFGALTQLRSLDLTDTQITELPESLTSNICKLESVCLGDTCKFPEDITNWVELRRLVFWAETDHVRMPRGIDKLIRLEVLEPYIVSTDACSHYSGSSSIKELADLNSLQRIRIVNLENVRGGRIEAEMAQLKGKQNIQHLVLQWQNFKEEEMAVNNSALVLEGLQPHPNLEKLFINSFPGLKLPKWMGSSSSLPNLVELEFSDCKSCTELVGLGQLPCLQILKIGNMNSVKCLGKELYYQQDGDSEEEEVDEESKGSATTTATRTSFPSLTRLVIRNLESLEEWFTPENSFTYLRKSI